MSLITAQTSDSEKKQNEAKRHIQRYRELYATHQLKFIDINIKCMCACDISYSMQELLDPFMPECRRLLSQWGLPVDIVFHVISFNKSFQIKTFSELVFIKRAGDKASKLHREWNSLSSELWHLKNCDPMHVDYQLKLRRRCSELKREHYIMCKKLNDIIM
jgi:hypothetical protein